MHPLDTDDARLWSFRWSVWQDGQRVASGETKLSEALFYLRQYAQDGPAQLRTGTRAAGKLLAQAGKQIAPPLAGDGA